MFGRDKLQIICVAIGFLCGFLISSSNTTAVEIQDFDSLPIVGSIKLDSPVGSFVIKDSIAFFRTVDDLKIVSIKNLYNPKILSSLKLGYGIQIKISGNKIYTDDLTNNEILIIDVSNPLSTEVIGTYSMPDEYNLDDLYLNGNYIYFIYFSGLDKLNKALDAKFGILNIADSSLPKLISNVTIEDYDQTMLVSKKYAYISERSNLEIIDISDPASPTVITSGIGTSAYYSDMQVISDTVYLLDRLGGIYKIDEENPAFAEIELLTMRIGDSENMYITDSSIYLDSEFFISGYGFAEVDLTSGDLINFYQWGNNRNIMRGDFIVENGLLYYVTRKNKFKIIDLAGKTVINSIDKKKGFYGYNLVISGKGFTDNEGKVIVKGTKKKELKIVSWKDDEITGVIPWGINPGNVKIYIKKYNGVKSKNKKSFFYRKVRPKVKDAVFRANSEGGSDEIVLSGKNFGPRQGKTEKIIARGGSVTVSSWDNTNVILSLDKSKKSKLKICVKTRYGKSNRKIINLDAN